MHIKVSDSVPTHQPVACLTTAAAIMFFTYVCGNCDSDSLRIFFFQLTTAMMNRVEIADNNSEDTLPVNFEFSIDTILYVTRTTKPLARGYKNGLWTELHNEPDTSQTLGNPVRWPQLLSIHPKLFGIVYSLSGIYTCPYEGDEKTELMIPTTAETTQKSTSYSFRNSLYVSLSAYHVDLSSKDPVYAYGGDPNGADFWGVIEYELNVLSVRAHE